MSKEDVDVYFPEKRKLERLPFFLSCLLLQEFYELDTIAFLTHQHQQFFRIEHAMVSLTTFVRTFYAPAFWYGRLNLRSIELYAQSVKLYLFSVGDLQINQINPANNTCFLNYLQSTGVTTETIRKHCRHLNGIFQKMGPPGPKNRDAFGFLETAPWIRPPSPYKKLPRSVPDSLVDKLYHSTSNYPECFNYPKYLDDQLRPQFWKALILLAATTALRKGALFGLTWKDVQPDKQSIIIPGNVDKCKSERQKPLHSHVYRVLESIRFSDKLLHWTHGDKRFYTVWNGLNAFAGIEPHLHLHDLKRYALQLACRSNVDAATLQVLGDHSSLKTTLDHYAQGNLAEYVQNIRLPGGGMEVER